VINLKDGIYEMLCTFKLLASSIELLKNSDAEGHEIDLQVIGSNVERLTDSLLDAD